MISKDSQNLNEFIRKISDLTDSRHFIKGALLQIESEEEIKSLIDYMDNTPDVKYSDVMYELAKKRGLTNGKG